MLSVYVGVAINPSYIKDCLAKNSDPLNLVEQSLAETTPLPLCVCFLLLYFLLFVYCKA